MVLSVRVVMVSVVLVCYMVDNMRLIVFIIVGIVMCYWCLCRWLVLWVIKIMVMIVVLYGIVVSKFIEKGFVMLVCLISVGS